MNQIPTTKSAGGFVLNRRGQVLMVQEYGYFWGLPRGHISIGESPEAAARREILEEAGVTDLVLVFELGSYSRSTFGKDGKPNHKEIKHMTFFYFQTSQTALQSRDKAITAAEWCSPTEARQRLINNDDISFFDRAISKTRT